MLWLAAPVTGLIVQPIIGYSATGPGGALAGAGRTSWSAPFWRASRSMAMPNSSSLWMAAGLLWVLDASVNVTMEPFRAFVGDLLPARAAQLRFADAEPADRPGRRAVIGPAVACSRNFGWRDGTAGRAGIPQSVHLSFYLGAVRFLGSVLYTIVTTRSIRPTTFGVPR